VVAVAESVFEIPGLGDEIAMVSTVFVDNTGDAVDDVDIRLALEDVHRGGDGTRLPEIVGVQPREYVTPTKLPAAVNCVERPVIGLRKPTDPATVLFEQFDRSVGGPTIHDDTLDVRIVLGKNTLEGALQITDVVLTRNDN